MNNFFENDPIANAIRSLGRADRYHRAAIEAHVKRLGVHRAQHIILMHISHSPEPLSQGEIAKAFDVSPATIAVSLRKMEQSGLIERITSQKDARKNVIGLTDAGRTMVDETIQLFKNVDEAMFKGVSAEELQFFTVVLQKVQQNLKDYNPGIDSLCTCKPKISKERK